MTILFVILNLQEFSQTQILEIFVVRAKWW